MQPKVDIVSFDEGKDLECTIAIEVLPEIEPGDFKKVKLERLVVEPGDAEVDEFMTRLTEQQKTYEKVERAAQNGDQVVIDFVGSVDGVKRSEERRVGKGGVRTRRSRWSPYH